VFLALGQVRADTCSRTPTRSPKTVANNVSAIFATLQVADRAQAMVRAREAGLGT
jgi:DNA-binding NarL/FixJ family response regulator